LAAGRPPHRLSELFQLALAPHEAGQPASRRGVKPRAEGSAPRQVVYFDRRPETLHRHRSQRPHLDVAFGESQRVGSEVAPAPSRELFRPGSQVSGLADGSVVHVQIAADGADHDLARVEPDTNLNRDAVGTTGLFGPPANGGLHVESRVARPDGMILMRERCAEERHDPVAHDLVHGALVAVNRFHHPLGDRIQKLSGLLGVAVCEQLHRPLQIGEEHCDLLALALQHASRRENPLSEVLRGV
jgi:hypothetical protein